MTKKNKTGPGDYPIEDYLDACYNEDSPEHDSMIGHISRNIGEALESKMLGRDVKEIKPHLHEMAGGLIDKRIYRIEPFKKIQSPDFYLPDLDVIGDIKRIDLEKLHTGEGLKYILDKTNECIRHTLDKINDDVKQLVESDDPKICPVGVLVFSDYCIDEFTILGAILWGLTEGKCPDFNRVDSMLIYFDKVSMIGDDHETIGGESIQINRSGRIRDKIMDSAIMVYL